MNKIRELIIYNCAKCNLACKYCFISKNKSLLEVDSKLEALLSDPAVIFQKLAELKVDLLNINSIGVWGAEPLLEFNRVLPLLQELIKRCKNFNEIQFSTNCSHDNVLSAVGNLMNTLKQYPDRQFKIRFQISLDGPESITDKNRGVGVTKAVLHNVKNLVKNEFFCPDNVKVYPSVKATVDSVDFDYFENETNIISYYKFFEDEILDVFSKLKTNRINPIAPPIPNVASPLFCDSSKGKQFNRIIKILDSLEKKNAEKPIFRYYKTLVWFRRRALNRQNKNLADFNGSSCNFSGGFCGLCRHSIGILPDSAFTGCHRSFPNFCDSYKQNFNSGMKNSTISVSNTRVYDPLLLRGDVEAENFGKLINYYYDYKGTSLLASNSINLNFLAKCGQVDSKYNDFSNCVEGLRKLFTLQSFCASANVESTGDFSTLDFDSMRLWFNGAIESIFAEET